MEHIYCWSGGKDSTANIILAHIHNLPHGKIIMSEVMFNDSISGELPEHMEFVYNKAIPIFENWGFEVEVLHSDMTYMDCFNLVNQGKRNPQRKGMKYGFPMAGKCMINDRCKVKPIKEYLKSIDKEYIQYIGLAIDEPIRVDRMKKDITKKSLLIEYCYTEQMAYQLCLEYDLLSPMYQITKRGGCWFCPNARDCELKHLRNNHNELWKILLELEEQPNLIGNMFNTLKKFSIHDKEHQFYFESMQLSLFDYINVC